MVDWDIVTYSNYDKMACQLAGGHDTGACRGYYFVDLTGGWESTLLCAISSIQRRCSRSSIINFNTNCVILLLNNGGR